MRRGCAVLMMCPLSAARRLRRKSQGVSPAIAFRCLAGAGQGMQLSRGADGGLRDMSSIHMAADK